LNKFEIIIKRIYILQTETQEMTERSPTPGNSIDDFEPYNRVISAAAGKIAAHLEFRDAYNQELAFDFDPFRFFKVGENKISEILAALLKPDGRHGQGDLFISDFIERVKDCLNLQEDSHELTGFESAELRISTAAIQLEKPIDPIPDKRPGRRRIDIYIPLGGYAIAIENKVWAGDQAEQMQDYRSYLEKKHRKGHVLIYLTPYGHKPSSESLSQTDWDEGIAKGSLCAMSYKHHILPMLESWEAKCKAERVRFFIREFKNHLHVKFLGGNHLSMDKTLKDLVLQNKDSVEKLSNAYSSIKTDYRNRTNEVAKIIKAQNLPDTWYEGPFSNEDYYAFKIGLKRSETLESGEVLTDKIFVHLSEKNLELRLTYYIEKDSNEFLRTEIQKKWEETKKNHPEISEPRDTEDDGIHLIIDSVAPVSSIAQLMKSKVELFKDLITQKK
jgi:hypothetical protein